MMKMIKRISILILAGFLLGACTYPIVITSDKSQADQAVPDASPAPQDEEIQSPQNQPQAGADMPPAQQQPEPSQEPGTGSDGLNVPSKAINPLTGLPVQTADNLLLPPALVSITNFPPSSRPQAGLSYSPIVFELYIGDGMTRYLAIFYGDYPKSEPLPESDDLLSELSEGVKQDAAQASIGPIRSGRLPYEHVRQLFNGFIVMASAYSKVAAQLGDYVNVFGSDNSDPNSALIPVDDLEAIAKANGSLLGDNSLSGMSFDPQPPQDGKLAPSLWIFYAYKNQVFWRYNQSDGSYHRWQDNADGQTFIEQTDRLNGQPLTYENVIVLFADHEVTNKYLIDIDLLYVKRGKALLFRDGQMYEIYWTTRSEEYEKTTGKLRPIRFIDADGNPFALKPGQTWIELIPSYDTYWETVNSEKYNQLVNGRSKGSGYWGLYFNLDD